MNGHFRSNLLRSPDENVSELDDTPANLLVNIRSTEAAFVSLELLIQRNHIQRNGH